MNKIKDRSFIAVMLIGLSYALVNLLNISINVFSCGFSLIVMLACCTYSIQKNYSLFFGLIFFGVSSCFFFACKDPSLLKVNLYSLHKIIITILIIILAAANFNCFKYFKEKKNIKPKLFERRENDLKRVIDYLSMVNIIGLDASWGEGKSFLFEKLKSNISKEYEIVEISVLTCELDNLTLTIIKLLDDVLRRNGIAYSATAKLYQLKGINEIVNGILSFFLPQQSGYTATLNILKKKLGSLHKKILIVYEDLDRVTNPDVIKQVLAISEKMSGTRIKVIYQYDSQNMDEEEFSRKYLEKYIPYTIQLSPVNFAYEVKELLNELNVSPEILATKDFDIFSPYNQETLKHDLQDAFKIDIPMSCYINSATVFTSVRGVKQFILETITILQTDREYKLSKKIILKLFYLKHFRPELYDILKKNNFGNFLNSIKYKFKEQQLSFQELVNNYGENHSDAYSENSNYIKTPLPLNVGDIKEIFRNPENQNRYVLFNFLGYSQNTSKNNEANIRNEEQNNKIDRIVGNMILGATKIKTDREYVLKEVCKTVLKEPDVLKQQQMINKLFNKFYNQEIDGYNTINYIGHTFLEDIFYATRFVRVAIPDQQKLLKLYLATNKNSGLNREFFEIVTSCYLEDTEILKMVLTRFMELTIPGNFNKYDFFFAFLKHLVLGLAHHGYCTYSTYKIINYENNSEELKKIFLIALETDMKRTDKLIEKIKETVELREENHVAKLIYNSMEKIEEIMEMGKEYIYDPIKIESHVIQPNKKEITKLEKILNEKDEKEPIKKIANSYNNKRITRRELIWLLEKIKT